MPGRGGDSPWPPPAGASLANQALLLPEPGLHEQPGEAAARAAALADALQQGLPPDLALATLLRGFLEAVRRRGSSGAVHPRQWASLILVGGS